MDVFDVEKFYSKLETKYVGRKVVYKEVTGTTMDDAREDGLKGCPGGTIHLAETQTKARGARDHKWDATNKGNLYFSIVLYRPQAVSDQSYIEIFDLEVMAGMALLEIASEMKLEGFCLKWPNDVWVRGHKVSGILVEDGGVVKGQGHENKQLFILGMGINVNSDMRRNVELHSIATSMRCENGGKIVNREELLAAFCTKLEKLLTSDHESLFKVSTASQLFDRGLRVRVTDVKTGNAFDGVVEEITPDWLISVKDDSGKVWTGGQNDFSLRPVPPRRILVYNGELADADCATRLLAMFSSLVDTVTFSVEGINDTKLEEDNWREQTAIFVVGELTGPLNPALQAVRSFLQAGGSVTVVRSGPAMAFFSNENDVPEAVDSDSSYVTRAAEFCFNQCKTTVITKDRSFNMPSYISTNDFIGQYVSPDGPRDVPGAMVTVGAGKCAVFGFSVEMTYMDLLSIGKFSDDVISELSKTVFDRDALVQHIIAKLVLRN